MRLRTRRLFERVALSYPAVAISGRRLDDIAPRLSGIPARFVFGNYGGEPSSRKPPARVRAWGARLSEELSERRGVVVDDKGYSVTVHYRHARHKAAAVAAIHRVAATLPGARVLGGVDAATHIDRLLRALIDARQIQTRR